MRIWVRTLALGVAFASVGGSASAQERCEAASQAADKLQPENCDTCPPSGPDATFRYLDRAAESARVPLENRKLGVLAEKAVKDALEKGYDVGTHFDLAGYGVVGVDTGIKAILADHQSDLQKVTGAQGAVWLRHDVHAQAGVNLGVTVPVGPHGFYIRTGAGSGADVRVSIDKQYDPRLARIAENAVLNQLTIPYAAVDATSMKPGERTVISGNGNIVVYGGPGYGANVDTVIPNVSVGVSADSTETYVISGGFETEVSRENGNMVRVKLRTTHGDDLSGGLRVFAGASLNRDGLEIPMNTGINAVDSAVGRGATSLAGRAIEKVLRAEFVTRHGANNSSGDIQEYTFDMSRREARRAYEDALLGDFRAAAELASCNGGVGFVKETNDKVRNAYNNNKLSVSFLTYSVNSNSTDDLRTIRDAAGTRTFDLFNYAYDSRSFVGSSEHVNVGTVASLSGNIGADGKSVHLVYRGDMENKFFTSSNEMKELVAIGSAMAGGDLRSGIEMKKILESPAVGILPNFIDRYGRTKMALELTVSEHGIDRIGRASKEDLWAAFADPRREKPMWATAEGRAKLDEYGRCCRNEGNNGRGGATHMAEHYWYSSYQRAQNAIDNLSLIGQTNDPAIRARALRDAAQAMGNDFTAGAAFATLAGERSRSVNYSIKASNGVDYTWTQVGDDSATVSVR